MLHDIIFPRKSYHARVTLDHLLDRNVMFANVHYQGYLSTYKKSYFKTTSWQK